MTEVSEKQAALNKALGRMNKSFDKSANRPLIITSDNFDLLQPKFLSTGVIELDSALGGGFVRGGISALYGKPGGGKSMLSYMTAKKLLDEGGTVVIFAAEGKDIGPALAIVGIDETHPGLIIIRPEGTLEQIVNMIYLLLYDSTTKKLTRAVDLMVFDSINAVMTGNEIEVFQENASKDDDKAGQMARKAAVQTKLVEVIISQNLLGADTAMVFICQVRASFGMGKDYKAAIPLAVEHAAKMIIEIKRGSTITGSLKLVDGVKEMKAGHQVVATVDKNSIYGKPGVQIEYGVKYLEGMDDSAAIVGKAEEFGYFLKGGDYDLPRSAIKVPPYQRRCVV